MQVRGIDTGVTEVQTTSTGVNHRTRFNVSNGVSGGHTGQAGMCISKTEPNEWNECLS